VYEVEGGLILPTIRGGYHLTWNNTPSFVRYEVSSLGMMLYQSVIVTRFSFK